MGYLQGLVPDGKDTFQQDDYIAVKRLIIDNNLK